MKVGSHIESIGIKLPVKKVTSSSITDQMRVVPPVKLELISGIKDRNVCSGSEDAITLAVGAALDCLKYSSLAAADIDMIIYSGISKLDNELTYHYEPAISLLVKQRICAEGALSFDVSNACAGMITGVHIANTYIESGIVSNCMVVSGEYISSVCKNAILNMLTPTSQELASLTVGDAGTAVILESIPKETGFEVLDIQTFSQYSKLCTAKLSKKYSGAQMFTQMQKLHKVSINEAPHYVDNCLAEKNLQYADIDVVIPHQTAKRAILSGTIKFKEYFGSSPKEIVYNLEHNGNTASTTHFLALYSLLKEKKLKSDDRILLLALASGLVLGVIVFKPKGLIEKYGQ